MRLLILTEGGKDIGFGHLMRSLALAQAVEDICKGAKIKFVVFGDGYARRLLRSTNGRIKILFFNWSLDKKRLLGFIRRYDFVIIDSYLAEKAIYNLVSSALQGRLLIIDDYKRIDYPAGILLNPSLNADRLNYKRRGNATYLLGRDYIILRKEFWKVPRRRIRKMPKDVLLTFGPTAKPAFVTDVVRLFIPAKGLKIHVVFPGNGLKLSRLQQHGDEIKLYRNISAKDVRSLMLRCDFCISGGGQTLFELARCRTPVIGICLARNQRNNLKSMEAAGYLRYAGWYNGRGILKNLREAVDDFISCGVRARSFKNAKCLVDGQGAIRISQYLHEAIYGRDAGCGFLLRPASQRDICDLWRWRNSPGARRWSFNSERIPYKIHKAWFNDRLKDNNTQIYIAEDKRGVRKGQVRFDVKGHMAMINVNLNPKHTGQGLGAMVIREGTELLLRRRPSVKRVRAEVIDENIASKKSFQGAGYRFSHNRKVNEKTTAVFKKDRA